MTAQETFVEFCSLWKRINDGSRFSYTWVNFKTEIVPSTVFGEPGGSIYHDGQLAGTYKMIDDLQITDYDDKLMQKSIEDLRRVLILEELANV
jgi:hypothetical protein